MHTGLLLCLQPTTSPTIADLFKVLADTGTVATSLYEAKGPDAKSAE